MIIRRFFFPADLPDEQVKYLVQRANQFESELVLRQGRRHANAKQLLDVFRLGIRGGEALELSVKGADEHEAAEGLAQFFVKVFRPSAAPGQRRRE